MSDEHSGFEYWEAADLTNPFPVGQINLYSSDEHGASASVDFTIPTSLPHKKTVAERSIGIADSSKLWFALECTENKQGKIACEAVLRGKHLYWYPEHGETAGGELLELRLGGAELAGAGFKEALDEHGPHCDALQLSWYQSNGKLHCSLNVAHLPFTIPALLEMRRRTAEEHQRHPYHIELKWTDYGELDKSYNPPKPKPVVP